MLNTCLSDAGRLRRAHRDRPPQRRPPGAPLTATPRSRQCPPFAQQTGLARSPEGPACPPGLGPQGAASASASAGSRKYVFLALSSALVQRDALAVFSDRPEQWQGLFCPCIHEQCPRYRGSSEKEQRKRLCFFSTKAELHEQHNGRFLCQGT